MIPGTWRPCHQRDGPCGHALSQGSVERTRGAIKDILLVAWMASPAVHMTWQDYRPLVHVQNADKCSPCCPMLGIKPRVGLTSRGCPTMYSPESGEWGRILLSIHTLSEVSSAAAKNPLYPKLPVQPNPRHIRWHRLNLHAPPPTARNSAFVLSIFIQLRFFSNPASLKHDWNNVGASLRFIQRFASKGIHGYCSTKRHKNRCHHELCLSSTYLSK